jgi:serine protease Do
MFRKISLILIIATVCAVGYAQQTTPSPESKPPGSIAAIVPGSAGNNGSTYMEQLEQMHQQNLLFNTGGYLGVEPVEITKENMAKFGLTAVRGVAVEKVVENSPAQQAGVQIGDVIIAIDGEEVSSIRKLIRIISEISADHQAKLTILRNGEEREITVTLAKRPPEKFEVGTFRTGFPMPIGEGQIIRLPAPNLPTSDGEIFNPRSPGNVVITENADRQIGAKVIQLTKQLGEYLGVSDGKGMLITEVFENSPATKVGLKAGDIIIELDGKPITNQLQLTRALMEKKEGEVSLTIIRDKKPQTLKVTPSVVTRNGKVVKDIITTTY